jgi:hypothetical protein
MSLVTIVCSRTGRVLKVVIGTWLLIEGMTRATLSGLVMTMTGIVFVVIGLAGVCLVEEAIKEWAARHAARTPTQRDHR